jgi:hypothetical protein
MNIQMRIITEDNIDQLTNLSYQSRNIDKLLHIDHGEDGSVQRDIKEIIENYKKSLDKKLKAVDSQVVTKVYPGNNVEPQLFGSTSESSPGFWKPGANSEEFNNGQESSSLDYGFWETGYTPPERQTGDWYGAPKQTQGSPQYAPGSPAYQPDGSPQWAPGSSPTYIPGSADFDPNSPPWARPFNEEDKNTEFYLLPREIQDKAVRRFNNDEDRWNFIVEQRNIMKQSELSPHTPPIGGSINIFPEDPNMNSAFNMLSSSSQSKILQMDGGQRRIVMGQIMRQSASQSGGSTIQQNQSSNTPLVPYFEALPVQKQLTALQGGYNSMSKEFNSLAKSVHDEKITIIKPQTVQEQLYGKLPLLSVDQKGGNKDTTTTETSSSSTTSSNTTSSSDSSSSSSDSSVKKISFM